MMAAELVVGPPCEQHDPGPAVGLPVVSLRGQRPSSESLGNGLGVIVREICAGVCTEDCSLELLPSCVVPALSDLQQLPPQAMMF